MIVMNTALFQQYTTGNKKPVLVEFWAPWCVYCHRIGPALTRIEQEYGDSLKIGQVNIDDEPQLAEQEQIEVVPTLVLYQNGQARGSIVAPESKARIDAFIAETLGL